MLFTDVVGSTRLAAERGDRAWIELLRSHDEIVRVKDVPGDWALYEVVSTP